MAREGNEILRGRSHRHEENRQAQGYDLPFTKGRSMLRASKFLVDRPHVLQTMLAHFQDEAHKLHEQVQAQEREVGIPR